MGSEKGFVELAGCFIVGNGELLLLYREDEGHWEVPGGKVEELESPTEAAMREVKEEIGVEVGLEKPFFSGEFQYEGELYLWHGYIAKIKSGRPELQEDCFTDMEWVPAGELDEYSLAPNLKMVLPALRKL